MMWVYRTSMMCCVWWCRLLVAELTDADKEAIKGQFSQLDKNGDGRLEVRTRRQGLF